ncbi:MAG TPA: sulfurtransferase complex subunit TusD [Halieaceae bacterium]|jgi:tRNA 2-thiouridine synthesizing protein D|uniref:sulfurtransferase complex subunit TusD n=1 Tax=Haliea TaxID=475794 RepID=UPI0004196A56|nr:MULTISPECIES: sulfurtransferase complex subunit TusD [Haliea]HAN69525.1 sulfurtransferase complex subunit TusD [Halieaceae bacterium]MAD62987.1 sulfurtransferase complex subunit TusD [Haliea sp.]MAY91625.1 sulfurtransferase complex subunit TusD [Haliea sp.]MBK40608.1 sulfurtransferase complex subunit TusD [Haliea sp.]MBP68707.1 sulfurtransferase complex subunit TusD [Haliea sp.]|tara:strand:- start:5875 stop:6279 length:405 start_codon:yes stop_codon:yes gene_type:complete
MTLHYCLLVLAAPASGHTSLTAARFAAALLARGHTLSRVFFLDNGTSNGLATAITPQDERSPQQAWSALADANGTELVLCVSSAVKRGLLDSAEAQRHGFPAATVHPGFTLGGLGLLVEAMQSADRVVTFGAPA